jgi:hypothetical protein
MVAGVIDKTEKRIRQLEGSRSVRNLLRSQGCGFEPNFATEISIQSAWDFVHGQYEAP